MATQRFNLWASPKSAFGEFNGDDRDRTGNLWLAKPTLSQLSYVPGAPITEISDLKSPFAKATENRSQILNSEWAREESNFRPHAYQACALTD